MGLVHREAFTEAAPSFLSSVADKAQFVRDLQYLWRAIRDLSGVLLLARMAASAALALSPAASLW